MGTCKKTLPENPTSMDHNNITTQRNDDAGESPPAARGTGTTAAEANINHQQQQHQQQQQQDSSSTAMEVSVAQDRPGHPSADTSSTTTTAAATTTTAATSTSNNNNADNSRSLPGEDEVIPWKFVPEPVITRLVHKLNPEMPLSGNNWKALAGTLGWNSEEIRFLMSVQGVHAEVFLNYYGNKPDCSLNEFIGALKRINRKDCLEVLKEALPEIRQRAQSGNPSMLEMAEATSMLSGHHHPAATSGFLWPAAGPMGGATTMFVPAIFPGGPASLAVAGGQAGCASGGATAGGCCVHGACGGGAHVSMPCGVGHLAAASQGDSGCNMSQPTRNCASLAPVGGGPAPPFNLSCKAGGGAGLSAQTSCCGGGGHAGNTSLGSGGCMVAFQHQQQQQQQQQHQQFMQNMRPQGQDMESCMHMDTSLPQNISPVDNSNVSSNFGSLNSNISSNINSHINSSSGSNHNHWAGYNNNNNNNSSSNGNNPYPPTACSQQAAVRQKVARQYSDECKSPGGQQGFHQMDKRHCVAGPGHSLCQHCGREALQGQGTPPLTSLSSNPSSMWPSSMSESYPSPSSLPPPPTAGVVHPEPCQNTHAMHCNRDAGRREANTGSPKKLFIPSPSGFAKSCDYSASSGGSGGGGEGMYFPSSGSPSSSGSSPQDRCRCRSRKFSSSHSSSAGSCRHTESPRQLADGGGGGFFPPKKQGGPHSHKREMGNPQNQRAAQFSQEHHHSGRGRGGREGHAASKGGGTYVEVEVKMEQDFDREEAVSSLGMAAGNRRDNQGTSLALLEKMASIPDKYKPTSEYRTVVAEQKIEVERSRKPGKASSKLSNSIPSSTTTGGGGSSGPNSISSTHSGGSASSTICSASQTFPMRVKVRHERDGGRGLVTGGVASGAGMGGVEELGALTISKKSTSMPQDMKPQPYRKAWRGIKVFVTYSMDSAAHNDQVLCLGYFLKNNGFNCYLDTPVSPGKTLAAWREHTDKFHRKFYESDFVLVCLSPKYLRDVSISEPTNGHQWSASEEEQPRLHTLDIYQLMNQEYLNRQAFGSHSNTADKHNPRGGLLGGDMGEGEEDRGGGSSTLFDGGASASGSSSLSGTSMEVARAPQVVPVLFGDMTPDQIPRWMREVGVPCKRWEADYADLAWLLTKPQDRIRSGRQRPV